MPFSALAQVGLGLSDYNRPRLPYSNYLRASRVPVSSRLGSEDAAFEGEHLAARSGLIPRDVRPIRATVSFRLISTAEASSERPAVLWRGNDDDSVVPAAVLSFWKFPATHVTHHLQTPG